MPALKHLHQPTMAGGDFIVEQATTVHVFTTAIDNSTWTPITLPAGVDCNSALCKCRSATNLWKLSHLSGGSPYITYEAAGAITMDVDKDAAAILFYVQGTEGSDTFEVILLRRP